MDDLPQDTHRQTATRRNPFIRGVNIGGWLLLERFITPYMFALTDCHVRGDICWYPGQISAPPIHSEEHTYCDMYQCEFLLNEEKTSFAAIDEHSLAEQFPNKWMAHEYLESHWDHFLQKEDIVKLKEAGVTHLRVPLPHWIMGDIAPDEPYVNGQWVYFIRLVSWCRGLGIQVWPDIQTAPGLLERSFPLLTIGKMEGEDFVCYPWSESTENVDRSLKVVKELSEAIVRDDLGDVVTGFGLFSVPFHDCDISKMKGFYNKALETARTILGDETAIFVGDMLNATRWNTRFWTDEEEYANTLLESRSYHVLTEDERALSPKQHIDQVCSKDAKETQACCYEDAPHNKVPSKGISRIVGEWSAAFDTQPELKLKQVWEDIIEQKGEASISLRNRTLSEDRKEFLKQFVKAQMVTFESANVANGVDISRGWFFRTLKMEFGAFAEWDFLRGLKEGWIPSMPGSSESSLSIYGTCEALAKETLDKKGIVETYPAFVNEEKDTFESRDDDKNEVEDDDYVEPHVDSTSETSVKDSGKPTESSKEADSKRAESNSEKGSADDDTGKDTKKGRSSMFPILFLGFFGWGVWKVFFQEENFMRNRRQYTDLDTPTQMSV